ncbi:MAG: hypothetical protein GY880_10750 [Planctomycetaceae bacterium]|nr:hypothetical protein [Planctomycetaceae bacterium]
MGCIPWDSSVKFQSTVTARSCCFSKRVPLVEYAWLSIPAACESGIVHRDSALLDFHSFRIADDTALEGTTRTVPCRICAAGKDTALAPRGETQAEKDQRRGQRRWPGLQ